MFNIIKYFLAGSDIKVKFYLNLMCDFKSRKKICRVISNRIQVKYGVFISPNAKFDKTLKLRHPIGIVIGEGVKIEENVIIYQNVTIGADRIGGARLGNYPVIGSGTTIFSGAVLIGKIKIGKNCIIGANSVVTKDVPDNHIFAGVPARLIGKNNEL
ncbi:serine O-acetyltransferase [Vibrio splendidus]